MALRSTLSILGLYNYDNTIFDTMWIPDGVSRAVVVDNILAESAEMEVIYPDPQVMKRMIGAWSKSMTYKWNTLYKTEHLEYNPIWNKVGTVIEVETRDLQRTDKGSNKASSSSSDQSNSETLTDVSAFDSSGYSNRDKVTDEAKASGRSTSEGSAESSGTDTGTITHERRETGNIGVTTTQGMLKEERQIADFSIYKVIVSDFQKRFCLLIY